MAADGRGLPRIKRMKRPVICALRVIPWLGRSDVSRRHDVHRQRSEARRDAPFHRSTVPPLMRAQTSVLELLEVMQHLAAVERADVARLRRRQPAYRPAEMHEVRLDRMREWMHSDLFGHMIALPRVARAA